MKILVLGASGLVGGNCLKYMGEMGQEVIGTYFSFKTKDTVFFDTLNLENTNNFNVDDFSPDAIVHCGALTHVDYCEDNKEESYEKTVRSTLNVISLCKQLGAKLVYISTDYVFDGSDGPYSEEAVVNPISVYGKHKLEAENAVLQQIKESIVIRITNVYGDEIRNKNFISRIVGMILKNEKLHLRLPVDQYATPVNAHDVARAIYELLLSGKEGLYNISSSDFLNRVELVQKILNRFPEAIYDMVELPTEELNQPAPRPLKGGLENNKFLAEFPKFEFSTVDDYLDKFEK